MASVQLKLPPKGSADAVRLPGEAELQRSLSADQKLSRLAAEIKNRGGREADRRRLLAGGLRVTERNVPALAKAVDIVRKLLHIAHDSEVYVCDDPQQNASCMRLPDGRISILVTARLLERMGPQELIFVLGHEMGHALFDHHALPSGAMLQSSGELEAKEALQLLSWSRQGEISCDRVGLLCCQDLQSAATALIKLSSGLKEPALQFHLQDYIDQMREIHALAETVDDQTDWFASHPLSPLRVVALNYFWESKPLDDILGHGKGTLSAGELKAKVQGLLGSMDPEGAAKKSPAANSILLWGSFWVAAADGEIGDDEVAAISTLVDAKAVERTAAQVRGQKDPVAFILDKFKLFGKESRRLPRAERYALLQRITAVARSDGHFEAGETAALRALCRELSLNPNFVDQIRMAFD